MQSWEIVGICEAEDYDEDLEECGQIRAWYETKIEDLPEEFKCELCGVGKEHFRKED